MSLQSEPRLTYSRAKAFLFVALAFALFAASPTPGWESSNPTGRSLRITGDVGHPLVLHEGDLLAMRR